MMSIFMLISPKNILQGKPEPKIVHLEMWAIIVAVRIWGSELAGKIIRIKTDNEAVAHIINTGRSRDNYLQTQLRELVWWLSKYQFRIIGVFIPGKTNKLPDILSRWSDSAV